MILDGFVGPPFIKIDAIINKKNTYESGKLCMRNPNSDSERVFDLKVF